MISSNGSFTDLRLNHQEGQNQESFWPSFTDIMTVIVMIFMIAMVVLLLRNMELVKQLRATMEAERAAMELARTTGEEKESLALRLIATENELSMLRIRLMRLEEERTQQATTIGAQTEEIAQLVATKQELTLRRDQLVAENFTLSEKLKRAETNAENLRQSVATLKQSVDNLRQDAVNLKQDAVTLRQKLESSQEQLQSTRQELAEAKASISGMETHQAALEQQLNSLHSRYAAQSDELQAARAAGRHADRELANLRSDFADLKVKYDELVRPARSPKGHFVVEVRYGKANGEYTIEYQTAEEPGYRKVSREMLERKLAKLKKQKQNGLYIKVIFPKESGLSFNEAWSFTSHLHERYDYYFQGGGPKLVPAQKQGQ